VSRQTVTLNGGDWRLGQSPTGADPERAAWDELGQVDEWLPAVVPGNVRADLLRAGRLPDPAWGRQNELAQWPDDHCWWLVRDLSLALPRGESERVHLVLRGADYISDLFLDGRYLGHHEGMFSPQVYDVTNLLSAESRLAVRITGSRWLPCERSSRWERILNQIEARAVGGLGRFPHRRDTLKCQMGFGWDFSPPVRTMGLWDDVSLVVSDNIFIRDVAARALFTGDGVTLVAEVEIDARLPHPARMRCSLSGETFAGEPLVAGCAVELTPGIHLYRAELAVPQPRLWWPWDHGRPDLYRLTVEVLDGDQVLDSCDDLIGLRQVELDGWTLRINGHRVYARGANWVPADMLPGRVTEADYRHLLTLARKANMNMLRVWGGGLREKRAFYEMCDRLGILVWQEFPVACAFVARYPRSPEYLQLAEAEAGAIVRDLQNHASVVVWCGGNEFSPRRNSPLVEALQRAAAGDASRPFLPASPHSGDSHNWQVWHGYASPAAYRRDMTRFASEFGLQALPSVAALRRFIPEGELWPPGPSWSYHNAGLKKLERYARPFLGGRRAREVGLDAFVQASQRAQAHGLQIAIEHYRRRKAEGCGGVLVWQLNEPWPAISWALIGFFRELKPAYDLVKRLFNPVLISADYDLQHYRAGDPFSAEVWIVLDGEEPLRDCRLEVILLDGAGQTVSQLIQRLDVAADSAEVVGHLGRTLPEGDGWRLVCRLEQQDQVVTENEYDLAVHDGLGSGFGQRLWQWLTRLVMPE
jgi:beta-mannosidase